VSLPLNRLFNYLFHEKHWTGTSLPQMTSCAIFQSRSIPTLSLSVSMNSYSTHCSESVSVALLPYLWLCSYPLVFSHRHPCEQLCFPALVALVHFHVEHSITSVKSASSLQTTVSRCFCMLLFVPGEPQTSSHFYGHAPENHI